MKKNWFDLISFTRAPRVSVALLFQVFLRLVLASYFLVPLPPNLVVS
jgi:hypothetical protein